VLQQAVCESSGGRANIEADFPAYLDSEIGERAVKFQASATCIFRRTPAHFNARVLNDLRASFFTPLSIYAHFTCQDHGLCFFTRFSVTAFDDEQVEPLLCGFWFGWQEGLGGQVQPVWF
jgi:hypothetical protein